MSIIFLSGFSGSGKTTLGKLASQNLNLPFIDLDAEIEKETGLIINKIFSLHGEIYFRKIEKEILQSIVNSNKISIVALGGGTITNIGNYNFIKSNGIIVLLNRNFKDICKSLDRANRPLLKKPSHVKKLFIKRKAIYNKHKDYTFYVAKQQKKAVANLSYRIKYYLSVCK